jgi:hypothetical protein
MENSLLITSEQQSRSCYVSCIQLLPPSPLNELPLLPPPPAELADLAPPEAQEEPPNIGRNRQTEPLRQLAGHIPLKIPEDVEPPGSGEDVLIAADLEVGVGGHGVVDPPQPAGHEVSEKDINAVVSPGYH